MVVQIGTLGIERVALTRHIYRCQYAVGTARQEMLITSLSVGCPPVEVLLALYSGVRVFVYPSLYEGFGLPPLEAMACGTPVVTSNTSSLPEVVCDAGVTVSPTDTVALAKVLADLLFDSERRQSLREAGLARAAQFSWERAARELLAIYQRFSKSD